MSLYCQLLVSRVFKHPSATCLRHVLFSALHWAAACLSQMMSTSLLLEQSGCIRQRSTEPEVTAAVSGCRSLYLILNWRPIRNSVSDQSNRHRPREKARELRCCISNLISYFCLVSSLYPICCSLKQNYRELVVRTSRTRPLMMTTLPKKVSMLWNATRSRPAITRLRMVTPGQ